MPALQRKSLKSQHPLVRAVTEQVKRRPLLLFGLPFVGTLVGASFVLSRLTQTRYDYNATRVQSVSYEEKMQMSHNRKKVDLREEYFRLSSGWSGSQEDSESSASSTSNQTNTPPPSQDLATSPAALPSTPQPSTNPKMAAESVARRKKEKTNWDWDGEQKRVTRFAGMEEWGGVNPEERSPEVGVRLV